MVYRELYDAFESMSTDLIVDSYGELAMEAIGTATGVVARTNEADRLAIAGYTQQLDECKDAFKEFKHAVKKRNIDAAEIKKTSDDLIKKLEDLKSAIQEITPDPKNEKRAFKILMVGMMALMGIISTISIGAGMSSGAKFAATMSEADKAFLGVKDISRAKVIGATAATAAANTAATAGIGVMAEKFIEAKKEHLKKIDKMIAEIKKIAANAAASAE